jgi:hypothetical protein
MVPRLLVENKLVDGNLADSGEKRNLNRRHDT